MRYIELCIRMLMNFISYNIVNKTQGWNCCDGYSLVNSINPREFYFRNSSRLLTIVNHSQRQIWLICLTLSFRRVQKSLNIRFVNYDVKGQHISRVVLSVKFMTLFTEFIQDCFSIDSILLIYLSCKYSRSISFWIRSD